MDDTPKMALHRPIPHDCAALLGTAKTKPLEPILTFDDALAKKFFVLPEHQMERGEPDKALSQARHRLTGRLCIGGQDLEGQVALAVPGEGQDIVVVSSTHHPSEAHHLIAKTLGLADHAVTVEVRRQGNPSCTDCPSCSPWGGQDRKAGQAQARS